MKKLILLFISISFVLISVSQEKSNLFKNACPLDKDIPTGYKSGVWAPMNDWTATDIDGVVHSLADYRAEGKYVIVDLSAVWCPPCWSLHQSGLMDDIHNTYGPDGTDELVMLWVEVEGAPLSELQGGGDSQGDWTEGGTWPVPIISTTSLNSHFAELWDNFIPRMFLICPSGYYKNIPSDIYSNGAAAVYNETLGCPDFGQPPVAQISGPANVFMGEEVSYTNIGISLDPITGYTWTFPNADPESSDAAEPVVVWNQEGDFTITLVVENEFGESDPVDLDVTVVDCSNPIATFPWTETFENTSESRKCWSQILEQGIDEWTFAAGAGGGSITTAYQGTINARFTSSSGGPFITKLVTPIIEMNEANVYDLDFWYGQEFWSPDQNELKVYYRVSPADPWVQIAHYSSNISSWTNAAVDLPNPSATYQLAFEGINKWGRANVLDNVRIQETIPTNLNDNKSKRIVVFPNPSNGIINIMHAENASVQILNITGQIVFESQNLKEYNQIDVSNLPTGTYFVNMVKDTKVYNEKILIVK
jgi:hypothetical protein